MKANVKCPNGCHGVIEIGMSTETAAAGRTWIDADGNYQTYDPNIRTTSYYCTVCRQSFIIRKNSKGEVIDGN